MIALVTGCVLDLIVGDPHGIPHPVVYIGRLISALERRLYPSDSSDAAAGRDASLHLRRGTMLWITVVIITVICTALITITAYILHPYAGIAVEACLTCYIMAARSLRDESMKVYKDIGQQDIEAARHDLSMIVGRDTDRLDNEGIIRAAVETVAENTSDGVIAPLICTVLGGPILGMLYKAVNTMDSMLGYHNDRYEYFGRTAARADDVFNFIPSRISALLIILSSAVLRSFNPDYSPGVAYRIWKRDRRCHLSPNSAQTESACAGALMVNLGGTSYYGGVPVEKPQIGDPILPVRRELIRYANRLMFASEFIMLFMVITIYLIGRQVL